jgi:hypothetical protein
MTAIVQFDWTIRVTDIVMILALIMGPVIAVQIAEYIRKKDEAKKRKIRVFQTLMATRTASLAAKHIDALNLVEIEFHSLLAEDRKVVDRLKLYKLHLEDATYLKQSQEAWTNRKDELLIDLLYEMSVALGYSFDKSQMKSRAYYPQGYVDAEKENLETRKLWLEILKGQRQLPMKAEVYTNQPPASAPPAPK